MSGRAIPYLLIGDSARRGLEERATRAVHAWRHAWLPSLSTASQVTLEDMRTRPIDIHAKDACCFRVYAGRTIVLTLVVPRRSIAGLVGAPQHGADASTRYAAPSSLTAALEREALLRLSVSLLTGIGIGELTIERLEEGAVEVQRECDSARFVCLCVTVEDSRCMLDVLVAPEIAEKLLPHRAIAPATEKVQPRKRSLGDQSVTIEGVLGTAEVSVAELAALAVGDVVVLEQPLNHPGSIAVRGGEKLMGAALGRVDGKRAMQIKGKAA